MKSLTVKQLDYDLKLEQGNFKVTFRNANRRKLARKDVKNFFIQTESSFMKVCILKIILTSRTRIIFLI